MLHRSFRHEQHGGGNVTTNEGIFITIPDKQSYECNTRYNKFALMAFADRVH